MVDQNPAHGAGTETIEVLPVLRSLTIDRIGNGVMTLKLTLDGALLAQRF